MPRFFFHVEYGETSPDEEGTEFPDLARARQAAVVFLTEILRDLGDSFWTKPAVSISVADETGLVLWRLDATGTESAAVLGAQAKG